ncbi:hypothetical protein [Alicyclobacillus sp. SO9]|uniref:hypothetical protein n=1 Tax=Alicyclobacillus sp. SO9 TaxID=2665646 RepID=UPI0018E78E19|nr:hypothetical protein [Alicyclobacillus sp. SO9]QQE78831.1 hypothetical protein GI364_23815 [Alicyclobacillus sp. SO9]
MKFVKSSMIPLGTVIGLLAGYCGIPVPIPGYSNNWHNWVWNQPYGFYVASIILLGALGWLAGVFFHSWIWKHSNSKSMMWVTGILGIALLLGTIGVYRHHAYNESIKWTQINLGFVRTLDASEANLSPSTPNKDRSIGTQIIQAGSDMGSGDNFKSPQYPLLGHVASALSEAGYYMVTQQDKRKFRESIAFVNDAGSMIKNVVGNQQSYPNKTKHFQELLKKINSEIPKDFDKSWEAN